MTATLVSNATGSRGAIHVPAAHRCVLWFPEGAMEDTAPVTAAYRVRMGGAGLDGPLARVEVSVPAGSGPPAHVHPNSDEAYFVLTGEVEVYDQGRTFVARAGDFVLIPRGTLHAWKCTGDEPTRMLFLLSPAGFPGLAELVTVASRQEVLPQTHG